MGLFDFFDWLANDVIGTDNVLSWDSVLGNPHTGWFAQISNFAAGMGDTVSMGLTKRVRLGLGYDDVVDYHSGAYVVGEVTGTGVNVGLAFVNPCALSGSLATGVRVLNGIQAVGGTLNAGDNLAAGHYGAAALDLVGVAGNSFQMLRPCFPGEVQVLTRQGWVRWDALTTNDEVVSLPEQEPEGELAYRPVEEVFRRWGVIWEVTVAGRVLRTTAEHPFWVRGKGWTAAKDLQVGDELRSHDGQWLAVEDVRDTGREEVVYNCRVAEYHTYFVGEATWGWSIWAHNSYTPPNAPATGATSRLVPGGGLAAHEAAGGHTIARHVGRTDTQLAARLAAERRIPAASTFPDRATAERAIADALNARAADVKGWLSGSAPRLDPPLRVTLPYTTGRSLPHGAATTTDVQSVLIVLQRDASLPTGYRIVTAYPVP